VVVVTSGWDAPKTLAIHDLRAIHPAPAMDLSGSGLQPLPINQEEFVYVLSNFLATTDSSPNPSPSARVAPWGGSLIAVETPENHRRLRVILEGLRDTIPRPGLGKPPSARSRLLALLEQPMGEVRFDGVTLEEAIDGLRKQSHANIVVDWPALESVGVERLAKVRMRLWNVPLRLALSTLFTNQRGKDPGLDFDVEENVITVTQFSSLLGDVRVYDVRDLVAASVARRSATLAAIAKALPSAPTNLNPLSQEQIETEENGYFARLVLDMVDHIELHNDRSDLISAWYGRLLIRASPTVHKDIEEFLRRLRESVRDADGVGAGEPAIGPGNRPSADGKPQ
ncbi:MAG: hypothetical protein JWO87_2431, partial [Phycisphaerales bacterium]|nr:hypothetical protein [Phycisphaerales bacterium]